MHSILVQFERTLDTEVAHDRIRDFFLKHPTPQEDREHVWWFLIDDDDLAFDFSHPLFKDPEIVVAFAKVLKKFLLVDMKADVFIETGEGFLYPIYKY